MAKTKQQKAEELVYDAIEDIEDEFQLSIKRYPEVYYIHRGLVLKV